MLRVDPLHTNFHHITGTQNIPYFIKCLAHQLSTTTGTQNIPYFITCLAYKYPPHFGHTEHTIFQHSSGTPAIHHISGTQNIPYFITYLAYQLSTALRAYRTYHISLHAWHTNYPPHYGHTDHIIFHHMSGTPTIHHITDTQNLPYFITCLAHQLSTTIRVHRT